MKAKKNDALLLENYKLAKTLSTLQETNRRLNISNAHLVQERNRYFIGNVCLTEFFTTSFQLLEDFKSSFHDKETFIQKINGIFLKTTDFLCSQEDAPKDLNNSPKTVSKAPLSDLSNFPGIEDKPERARKSPVKKRSNKRPVKLINYSELSPKQALQPQGKSSLEIYDFPADENSSPVQSIRRKRTTIYRSSDENEGIQFPESPTSNKNNLSDDMVIAEENNSIVRISLADKSQSIIEEPEIKKFVRDTSIPNVSIEVESSSIQGLDDTFTIAKVESPAVPSKPLKDKTEKEPVVRAKRPKSSINIETQPMESEAVEEVESAEKKEPIKLDFNSTHCDNKENSTDSSLLNNQSIAHSSTISAMDSMMSDYSSDASGRNRRQRKVVSYKLPSMNKKLRKGDSDWCRNK